MKIYPDNSEIYERKARGRIELAKASFSDKLDTLDKLRNETMGFKKTLESYQIHFLKKEIEELKKKVESETNRAERYRIALHEHMEKTISTGAA